MDKEDKYKNFAIAGALFLIIGLFINFNNQIINGIFDIAYYIIGIFTYALTLLFLRKKIVFVGFILFVLSTNFTLLTNSLFPFDGTEILLWTLKWSIRGLSIISVIFVIVGLFNLDEIIHFKQKVKLNEIQLTGITIILTFILQIGLRLIY